MKFEEYAQAQGAALLRVAFLLTGDAHRAEDLTQTVLTDVFRRWRRVAKAQDPDAYVRRMLVNAHLDWHRKRSSGELPADLSREHGHDAPGPVDATAAVDSRDELRRLLAALPARTRTMLVLRYYVDLDDRAVAELLDVAPSTVRATTSRALAALREERRLTSAKEQT